MVKLDKWESQFVLYSKGHFNKTNKDELDYKQVVKNIWENRAGFYIEDREIGWCAQFLLSLVRKLGLFDYEDKIARFIGSLSPINTMTGETRYKTNVDYMYRVIWVCLFEYLSTIQVIGNDEEVLVEFEEFDPLVCMLGVEEFI